MVDTLVGEVKRLQGALVELQQEMVAKLALKDAEIILLKDEIARLKGLPPRPKFGLKPSGMEGATAKSSGKKGRKRPRGSVRDKVVVTSEVTLKATTVPLGSRFRATKTFWCRTCGSRSKWCAIVGSAGRRRPGSGSWHPCRRASLAALALSCAASLQRATFRAR